MNARNVAALQAIMEPHDGDGAAHYLAERLAEAGVIAPSVLTDGEALGIGCHDREDCSCAPEQIRAELERIARSGRAS